MRLLGLLAKIQYRKEQNKFWEFKNTITQVKNSLEGYNSRLDQAEESVSKLKDTSFEIIQSEKQKEKRNEESLMDLWDTIKRNEIHIMGVVEREEREKEKTYLKILYNG